MPSAIMEPRVLLDGLAYVESPRWHDGRLWFCHWSAGEMLPPEVIVRWRRAGIAGLRLV
jgi:hypothetical protein